MLLPMMAERASYERKPLFRAHDILRFRIDAPEWKPPRLSGMIPPTGAYAHAIISHARELLWVKPSHLIVYLADYAPRWLSCRHAEGAHMPRRVLGQVYYAYFDAQVSGRFRDATPATDLYSQPSREYIRPCLYFNDIFDRVHAYLRQIFRIDW